jgi:DNA ligase-1
MFALSEAVPIATLQMWFNSGFEFWVTDKFDGIRALTCQEGVLSRRLKQIPNLHIQNTLANLCPIGFDGELMTAGSFNDVQSEIMTKAGTPTFRYHVFDDYTRSDLPYLARIEHLKQQMFGLSELARSIIHFEFPRRVSNMVELDVEEQAAIDRGNEGLIMRVGWGPYKWGRSTLSEAYMLKLKRWQDAEATIIGVVPLQHNLNPPTMNALGLQERGHGMQGKVNDDMLGAFICTSEQFGTFNIGGPFTELQRCKYWNEQSQIIGRQVSFHYLPYGTNSKPRSPKFKGFRFD